MKFADENKALHLLENISYYRLSGYWYPLLANKKNHTFKTDATFEAASNPFPPSFILLETTSFGALSRLYDILKSGKDKKDVAKSFGLPDKVFASWLHSLVYIRNLCAHHARLWNRQVGIKPLYPKHTHNAWINTNDVSNRRLYYVLSMIIYLLNTVNPNHTFNQKLENLFQKHKNVDRNAMGFPQNWHTEPLWK